MRYIVPWEELAKKGLRQNKKGFQKERCFCSKILIKRRKKDMDNKAYTSSLTKQGGRF